MDCIITTSGIINRKPQKIQSPNNMTTSNPSFAALVELTRGPLVESIHFGVLVVVDTAGRIVYSAGDPSFVANLRSAAKPFQSLPLIEQGGPEHFHLTPREIAITCGSHMGTDDHVTVLQGLQAKIGVQESNLQCGTHLPMHEPTALALQIQGDAPTPNRHNCSGKHTGMLAQARLTGQPIENYLSEYNEIQKKILRTFAEMVDLRPEDVLIGIDGCSAPTFAAPLRNAALGYARLADPSGLPEPRASAIRQMVQAMMAHPDMISGPGGFDTVLMETGEGKIVCKSGAEGFQGIGLLPGALGPGSPALGIAYKFIDGDQSGRARPLVGSILLQQMGALSQSQREKLKSFSTRPLYNWRGLEVGDIRPAFHFDQR
jgi:L-asparaginase II